MNRPSPSLRSAASDENPSLGGRTSTSAPKSRAEVELGPPQHRHFRGNTRLQFKKPTNPKLAVITILCYLLVIHGGMTAWGAEDPSRFLFATNWYATFTHTLNENGSLNYTEPNTDLSCSA